MWRHHQCPWCLRQTSGIMANLHAVQVNPCLNDLHANNSGTNIPIDGGIPESQLQGIQPGVLQVTKVGYRLGCLLSEGLGHNVVRGGPAGVAELIGHL